MIKITPLPAFNDNYLWLIEGNGETWVVDPGDGPVVQSALQSRGVQLNGILITHHHADHVGGIQTLLTENLVVAGPTQSQHPLVNTPLSDGDSLSMCGANFQVLEVPGHTLNHLAYFAETENQPPILFCGDTLFAGGCGRLFEGTAAQMHQSLSRLAMLPPETEVYCAHEYTLANLAFAQSIEPDNQQLNSRVERARELREKGIPTVPSTISLELATNPFMRADASQIIDSVRLQHPQLDPTPENVFSKIRSMKDHF